MANGRVLVRAAGIRVVTERVEERPRAAARPVGGAELAHEAGRRMRDVREGVRIVVAPVRVHRADDVDARPHAVQRRRSSGRRARGRPSAPRSRRRRRTGVDQKKLRFGSFQTMMSLICGYRRSTLAAKSQYRCRPASSSGVCMPGVVDAEHEPERAAGRGDDAVERVDLHGSRSFRRGSQSR